MDVIFSKRLSNIDVTYRLAIPTCSLQHFDPIPVGSNSIYFEAVDETGRSWPFCLSIRTTGVYLKPILASEGWLPFVREKGLRVGDMITFFRERNEANEAATLYKVEFQKRTESEETVLGKIKALYDRTTISPWIEGYLGWIFAISNFVLELPSIVFEYLPSKNKPWYVIASLVISFAAIIICIVELLRNVKKANATWKWRPFPWFYCQSENHIPFGTFRETVGLVSAFGQCIVATINYGCWHLHADSTIKAPVAPIVFAFGLLCSELADDHQRKDKSSNGNKTPPHFA